MDTKISPLLKTPLSYYGGKASIIRYMLALVPDHEVYTEVFLGGGTLFWSKKPVKNETINDTLDIVVNFYKVIKNNYRPLKKRVDATLLCRSDKDLAKKIIRHKRKYNKVDLAWAAWFIFNFSYAGKLNGGLKYSNHPGTVVPEILKHKKERFTEHLVARIEHETIENRDAIGVLRSRNVSNAFHEIDPPYIGCDQGHYRGYTENNFIDLLEFLQNECTGKFMLHNYNSEILDDYVKRNGWNKKEIVHRLTAPRKSGSVKCEVIVYNYKLQPTLF
ncbi:MAG: DNA adenine methylase [Chitinophagaceae bacterium]|nr:MAG: DNA adenine methylase [Chitinophagaceae bacterium]